MLLRVANGARSSLESARSPLLLQSSSRIYKPQSVGRTPFAARAASTAQQRARAAFKPASASSSSSSPSPSPPPQSRLNAPTSTLPPPLDAPARAPDQSQPSYLFALGKAYLAFYKAGLKAVWANGKAAAEVRRTKLGGGTRTKTTTTTLTPAAGAESGAITRGEWLLLRRSAADRRRIPLFALLLAACGEFTPLVVVFASPLVPGTCRIPRQVARERATRQARRRLSLHDIGRERLVSGAAAADWQVERLPRQQVLHLGRALALYARFWDLLLSFPQFILRARIRRRFELLRVDDHLIRIGGGPKKLSHEELAIACEERGLDVLDDAGKERGPDALRALLGGWLDETQSKPMAQVVLVQ